MERWNLTPLVALFVILKTAGWCNASSIIPRSTELCSSNKELVLTEQGINSSASILLASMYSENEPCKLKIVAPSTHVINLQFSEPEALIQKALNSPNGSETASISCKLSVYISENKRTPVWEGNPCGTQPLEIELLTPHVKLVWTTPPKESHTRGRRLIVTAVGEGDVCTKKGQFICQKIGWAPKFCIASDLVCDGNLNCPKGSLKSDEDEANCKSNSQNPWEHLALEIFKNLKPSQGVINSEWLTKQLQQPSNSNNSITKTFLDWKELKKMEARNTSSDRITVDNISAALAHYGPWGYLMLGMLICGTVLMFCGLWECCCNHHKHSSGGSDSSPPSPPTTVLIIDPQHQQQQEDTANPLPPNYEDLDQPPSYTALFPNYKTCSNRNSLAANFVTPDGQIISSDGTRCCSAGYAAQQGTNSSEGQVRSDRQGSVTVDIERNVLPTSTTVVDLNNSVGRSEA